MAIQVKFLWSTEINVHMSRNLIKHVDFLIVNDEIHSFNNLLCEPVEESMLVRCQENYFFFFKIALLSRFKDCSSSLMSHDCCLLDTKSGRIIDYNGLKVTLNTSFFSGHYQSCTAYSYALKPLFQVTLFLDRNPTPMNE